MHSRIFELFDENNPPAVHFCCDNVPSWFTSSIADYVCDIPLREDDIAWLVHYLGESVVYDSVQKTMLFPADKRDDYFVDAYHMFIHTATELAAVSPDDFTSKDISSIHWHLFRLQDALENRFGFQIYYDGELYPLDAWMRYADPKKTYRIGTCADYHF